MQKQINPLALLVSSLLSLCLFISGCSKVSNPLANTEPKTDRYGVLYVWKDRFNPNQKNIYKEPADNNSGVVGEVKEHEVFNILGEKDFYFEIETKDKVKGWFPKSHSAELFYEADYKKEDKKDAKKAAEDKTKGKPDAVSLFGLSPVENMGMDPRTWFEASPKIDMELRELPYESSRVVAHAKAKHRYLITDVADTNVLAYTSRMVCNDGTKPELLATLDYRAGAFFQDNQVFDKQFEQYLHEYKFENEEHKGKGHSYWIRLKAEDGEGWVQPYNGGVRTDNWYKHKKGHPEHKYLGFCLLPKGNHIETVSPSAKIFDKPGDGGKPVEDQSFRRRILVLEEKDGWKKIMSFFDGRKAWVEAPYARPVKDRLGLTVAQIDSEAEPDRKEEPTRQIKGIVTGTDVRMRAGSGTYAKVMGYFDKGEEVKVLDEKYKWTRVERSDGTTGWISADYLKLKYAEEKK